MTLAQLQATGLGRSAIKHRLRGGRLVAVQRGVYAIGPAPASDEARWLAAVLSCGPGAALSHQAAGAHWRLIPGVRGPVDVTVPSQGGRARRRGMRIHRCALPGSEVVRKDGIHVTSVSRTLLDLAAVLPGRRLERALDEADYLGRLRSRELEATMERNRGRRGARVLRRTLARHSIGATRTRSELEEQFLALCCTRGLPRPAVNVEVEGFLVDFFWPVAGLVVETDGYAAHSKRSSFEDDRARTVALQAAGLHVLRFSYRQVIDKTDWVADHVERALAAGYRNATR